MNDFDTLNAKLDKILALLQVAGANTAAAQAQQNPLPVDLDGPRGNPEVRFDPKRWEGESHKGLVFSQCEPAFLDCLAECLDFFARKEDEKGEVDKNGGPKSRWTRLDAARARGWAERLRRPEPRPKAPPSSGPLAEKDIPF